MVLMYFLSAISASDKVPFIKIPEQFIPEQTPEHTKKERERIILARQIMEGDLKKGSLNIQHLSYLNKNY